MERTETTWRLLETGPACAVRFEVGFQQIDPDAGVYTKELPGILAFTIR